MSYWFKIEDAYRFAASLGLFPCLADARVEARHAVKGRYSAVGGLSAPPAKITSLI